MSISLHLARGLLLLTNLSLQSESFSSGSLTCSAFTSGSTIGIALAIGDFAALLSFAGTLTIAA